MTFDNWEQLTRYEKFNLILKGAKQDTVVARLKEKGVPFMRKQFGSENMEQSEIFLVQWLKEISLENNMDMCKMIFEAGFKDIGSNGFFDDKVEAGEVALHCKYSWSSPKLHINELDGIYGIILSYKLTYQSITYEHEGNWRKAIECYDLLLSTFGSVEQIVRTSSTSLHYEEGLKLCALNANDTDSINHKAKDLRDKHGSYKGLMRCIKQNGCTHIVDFYLKGLIAQRGNFQQDSEFVEMQYEAEWRIGNWEFSLNSGEVFVRCERRTIYPSHFHGNLHSCLRALQNGDLTEFFTKLSRSKQEFVLSICQSSKENTENFGSVKSKNSMKKAAQKVKGNSFSCQDAFFFRDTYGFPCYLNQLIAKEIGLVVDLVGFNFVMDEAREKSMAAGNKENVDIMKIEAEETSELYRRGVKVADDSSKFVWYQNHDSVIRAIYIH